MPSDERNLSFLRGIDFSAHPLNILNILEMEEEDGTSYRRFLSFAEEEIGARRDEKPCHRRVAEHVKRRQQALAAVGQWVGPRAVNCKVTGWIPGQDTCLGCGPGPGLGACQIYVSVTHPCFSLSLSPSLTLNLKN